jgi:glycosyltransferase involved in cell wall biosynthesis
MLHNIVPVEVLKRLPSEKTIFFAHDHNIYCRRHHYYTPLGRTNCQRSAGRLRCFLCSLGRNPAPPLVAYRALPAVVLSDFMGDNLRRNGFQRVVKLPAFIQTHAKPRSFMPDGVMRILFLGQLIRGKGADLMLKCLAGLDFPFSCTIAGDGNDRKMLEEMVRKLGLQQRVHFAGFVSTPESLWDKCDVFFFPIRWQEPFGLVGLEAMAHGVPVVAHDLGGVREWLEDGKNGFAIPAGKDAKPALELMFRNPEQLLEKMSSAAMKMAGEKFSGEKFVEEFKKLPEVLQ